MIQQLEKIKTTVNVSSEYGRLNAVLLHRPGVEIERMTPLNAADALYSDILSKHIVDKEYANFCGVFEKWCQVYYVEDILTYLLDDDDIRTQLVIKSCEIDNCLELVDELLAHPSDRLAKELIEGVEYHSEQPTQKMIAERYQLKPLYNLFFTRDASSSMYNEVLINSMSFQVRKRETLIYRAIFDYYFGCHTFSVQETDVKGHTEGGDVQIAAPNMLCIGQGIRTDAKGIKVLANKFAQERKQFRIITQELPLKPESFIHLDMVYTFLGAHNCMVYGPMLDKTGLFAGKATTMIDIDNGNIRYKEYNNILDALKASGREMEPVICGGNDLWNMDREQWHSGANFFALDDCRVIGYERNVNTIEAMDKAGFSVLPAEDVCSGKINLNDYKKCVTVFKASELPRAGGGARCMTMPINRDDVAI